MFLDNSGTVKNFLNGIREMIEDDSDPVSVEVYPIDSSVLVDIIITTFNGSFDSVLSSISIYPEKTIRVEDIQTIFVDRGRRKTNISYSVLDFEVSSIRTMEDVS